MERKFNFANGHCHDFAIALLRAKPETYTKIGAFFASGYAGEDPDAEILIHAFAMTEDGVCVDCHGENSSIEEMWESLQINVDKYDSVNEYGEEFDSESEFLAAIATCGASFNEDAVSEALAVFKGKSKI
jgi:hypothetical protein